MLRQLESSAGSLNDVYNLLSTEKPEHRRWSRSVPGHRREFKSLETRLAAEVIVRDPGTRVLTGDPKIDAERRSGAGASSGHHAEGNLA